MINNEETKGQLAKRLIDIINEVELLDKAIEKIESPSIRKWANDNIGYWDKYTAAMVKKNPTISADHLAVVILAEAIGLW
jgi:hypothetical protein